MRYTAAQMIGGRSGPTSERTGYDVTVSRDCRAAPSNLEPFHRRAAQAGGRAVQIQSGMQQLDLCCGKGEMLCQWSAQAGLIGIGVDISPGFLGAARQRAVELQCADRVTFVEADAICALRPAPVSP